MKKFSISLFIIISQLFISVMSISSQSLIPSGVGNYIQSTGDTDAGDRDPYMVSFFEVSDEVSGTLYFAVNHGGIDISVPGSPNNPDQGPNTNNWNYYLVGGTGTLSSSVSRQLVFANIGEATTGTVLNMQTYTNENGWNYFTGVSPSQGEHIGNKYYFKIVAEAPTGDKNGFQLDVSYANSGTPSGVASIRSFAYDWTLALINRTIAPKTWNLYPFVPDNAVDYIETWNYDLDNGEELRFFDAGETKVGDSVSGLPLTVNLSPSDAQVSTGFSVAGQTNSTWRLEITELDGTVPTINTTEFWHAGTNPAETYRTYSSSYTPDAADHVVLAVEDGLAKTGASETVTIQIVDATGNPVPYSRTVYVTAVGDGANTPLINASSSAELVITDASGIATFTVSDAAEETVTISLETDGAGGGSASDSSLPNNSANDSGQIVISLVFAPTISSVSNTTLDISLTGAAVSNIVITENEGGGSTVLANGVTIRVNLPGVLSDSVFTAAPTATPSGGAVGVVTISGGDTIVIPITGDFALNDTLTLSVVQVDSGTVTDSGKLTLDYDGSLTYPILDNKVLTVQNASQTIWLGTSGSGWNTAASWSSGVPAASAVVIIPDTLISPVLDVPTAALASLSIESGAQLDLAGNNLTSTLFSNNGTLLLQGTQTVTLPMDTDSGLVEYTAVGTPVLGNSYYNLIVSGTLTLGASLTVGSDLTVSGTLDASGGAYDVTVAGDADFTGGVFTKGTGTFILNGGTAQILTSAGNDLGNIQTSTAGTSLTMVDAGDFDAVTIDPSTTINSGGFQINAAGNWSNAGIYTHGNNLIIFNGTSLVTRGGSPFFDLTIAAAGTVTPQDQLTVNHDFIINAGGTYTHNGQTLVLNNTASNLTDSNGGTQDLGAVQIQDTTVTMTTDVLMSSLDITSQLTAGGNALTVSGLLTGAGTYDGSSGTTTVGGNFTVTTFTPNSGLVIFNGVNSINKPATNYTFYDLTIAAAGTVTPQDQLTVNHDFIINAGGTYTHNGQILLLNNTVSDLTDSNGGTQDLGAVQIQDTTVTMTTDVLMSSLDITSQLTVGGNNLDVTGVLDIQAGGTVDSTTGTPTVTVGSDVIVDGTLLAGGSTLAFGEDLTVSASGTLNGGSSAIGVGSVWNNTVGNFISGTSTVTLGGGTGAYSVAETDGFNNLTIITDAYTSAAAVTVGATFNALSGSLSQTGGTLTANAVTLTGGGLTITAPANLSVTADLTISNGTSILDGSGANTIGGNLTISAGAFDSAGVVAVTGDLLVIGGTSNPTAAGSVSAANANFIGAGTFNADGALNLTVNLSMSNGTLGGAGDIDVDGNVSLTAAAASLEGNGRTITVGGDWDEGAAVFNAGTGLVTFDGTTPGLTSTNAFYDVDITGAVTLTSTINIGGNWNNSGTFTHNGNLVVFNGAGVSTLISGGSVFNGLTVSGGTTVSVTTNSLSVTTLTLSAGTDILDAANQDFTIGTLNNSGTLRLTGEQTTQTIATMDIITGLVEYYAGAADGTVLIPSFFSLTVDGAPRSFSLNGVTIVAGNLILNGGTLAAGANNITLTGNFNSSGGGVFDAGTAQIIFTGLNTNLNSSSTFNNIRLNKTAVGNTLTLSNPLDVDGILLIDQGTLIDNGSSINVSNNLTILANGEVTSTGSLIFDGATIYTDAVAVGVSFAAGQIAAGSSLTTNNDLTFSGAFSVAGGGSSLNISGDTLLVGGNFNLTNLTTFTDNPASVVTITGTSAFTSNSHPINNLVINSGANTVTLQDSLTLAGDINISTGTLSLGTNGITLPGNWSNSGTFTAGTGTVTFNGGGTSIITGINSFYNLTCTTDNQILQFDSTGTQTIVAGGTMTITGTAGNLIHLVSNSSPAQWTLDMQGTPSISFAFVEDGAVAGGSLDIATTNSSNGGNNSLPTPGWVFDPIVWTGTTDTDWDTATNWDSGTVPLAWDDVEIANVGSQPATLAGATTVNTLTINNAASAVTAGFNLTINGIFSNDGILYRRGGDTVTVTAMDVDSGLIVYNTTGGAIQDYGTPDYFNLEINENLQTYFPVLALNIAGGLTITNGTLDTATFDITTGADVSITNGILVIGAGDTLGTGTNAITVGATGEIDTQGAISCGAFTTTGTYTNTAANTIDASGNVSISGTFSAAQTDNTLTMTGNGTTINAAVQIGQLETVPGAGNTVSIAGNDLDLAGGLTVTNGAFNTVAFNVTVAGLTDIDGTLNVSGMGGGNTFTVFGDLDFSGSGIYTKGLGTVVFAGGASKNLYGRGQDLGNVGINNTAGNIVVLNDNVTMDTLTLTGVNSQFHMNPAARAVTLTINTGESISNSGLFRIISNVNAGTITSGVTFSFTGTDIDYNSLTIHLNNLNAYEPQVLLGASEEIILDGDCTFNDTITLNGAGASLDIGTNILTTTDDLVTVTTGTLTIGLAGALDTGTGGVTVGATGGIDTQGSISCGAFTSSGIFTNTGANTINASGSVSISNTFSVIQTDNTLTMTGDGTTINASVQIGHLVSVPGVGNTISIAGNGLGLAGGLTVTSGTFDTVTFNVAVAGVTDIDGILDFSDNTGPALLDLNGNLDVDGTLNASGNGNINVTGDTDFTNGSYTSGSGTFTFDGAGAQALIPNTNSFGDTATGGTSIVAMSGTATMSNLSILGGTSFGLDGSGAAVVLIIENTGTVINGGAFVVLDDANTVTLEESAGNFSFTGTDIDYNVNVIHLSGLNTYEPQVSLSANEGIILNSNCTFNDTITLNGLGASLDIGTNILTTTDDLVTVTTGTLTIGLAGALNTGTGGVTVGATGEIDTQGAISCGAFTSSGTYTNAGVNTIDAGGNVNISGIFSATQADNTLTMTGNGTTINAAVQIGHLETVPGAGNTISIAGNGLGLAGGLTVTNGTFDTVTFNVTVAGLTDIDGELDFSAAVGALLDLNGNLDVDGTLDASGNGKIESAGDWNVDPGAVFLSGTGTVTFNGAGAQDFIAGGTDANHDFNNIIVSKAGGIISSSSDLDLQNLTIINGTFNASGDAITVHGNTWDTQTTTTATAVFTQTGSGSVTFTNAVLAINGQNTFFDFIYRADNGSITFEARGISLPSEVTQTIDASGSIYIEPLVTGNPITLNSDDPGVPPYPASLDYSDPPRSSQWVIDIDPTATATIIEVTIIRGNSVNAIFPDSSAVDGDGNTLWIFLIPIKDSWTEDIDGDGRIDRIRARINNLANLNNDFTGTTAYVEGYTVKSGAAGFSSGGVAYEFFINLVEKDYLDTDAAPRWRLSSNTSLLSLNGSRLVASGILYPLVTSKDRSAPAVGYTLAVAGKNEIFVHLSEPALRDTDSDGHGDGVISNLDFTYNGTANVNGLTRITTNGSGTSEFLLTLDGPVTAQEIYDQDTILLNTDLADMVDIVWTIGDPAQPLAVDTRLPSGNNIARVSDIGLGSIGTAQDGVFQPVFATTDSTIRDNLGGTGSIERVDYGDFDSSGWLPDEDFTLQITLDSSLSITNTETVSLIWDTSVGNSYLVNNMWLPNYNPSDLPAVYGGYIPYPPEPAPTFFIRDYVFDFVNIPNTGSVVDSVPGAGDPTRTYQIDADNPKITSGKEFQFLLRDSSSDPLIYARLGNPDALDWYRSVRPWSFLIRDIIEQEDRVTILDNVIDPTKGEKAELHYVLSKSGSITIQVFNLAGDLIDILHRGRQSAGEYTTAWDGRNRNGAIVVRGIYFVRFTGPGIDQYRKVMVVK